MRSPHQRQRVLALRHHKTGFSAPVIALFLWIPTAYASIVSLGPAFQVNTTFRPGISRMQQAPQVVALPDGGFVVIWSGAEDAPGLPPAFGRRFDVEGTGVGPDFQLQGIVNERAAAGATDGTLILNWDAFVPGAFVGRFADNGMPVRDPVGIVSEPTVNDSTVAVTPGGGFVAGWQATGPFLRAQRYDDQDQPVGSVLEIARDFFPQLGGIASDAAGGLVASWSDYRELGFSLSARQFDAQDVPLGEPIQVVAPGELSELIAGPKVCIDASGDFVVAWHDDEHPIEFRRYDAQGNATTPRLTAGLGGALSMACLTQRSIIIAGLTSAGGELRVIGRAFDAQTRPFGQFVIPVSDPADGPGVAALRDNAFVAAWPSCVESPEAGCDIFAQRFALTSGEDCTGDCKGDGVVTVDEIIGSVGLALFQSTIDDAQLSCSQIVRCPAIDTNLDCRVTTDELLAAVRRALGSLQ